MPIIATYLAAKALRDRLAKHGVRIKQETFRMKTSGIYIPIWLKDGVPYEKQKDGHVKWFFFFRFENGFKNCNVGELLLLEEIYGTEYVARHINGCSPFPDLLPTVKYSVNALL